MAQLALCRHGVAGVLLTLCIAPFSLTACGLSFLGAWVATLWPFWRQRDRRLLVTGWYGVNGALCGFLVAWHFSHPVGAVVLTVLAAWLAAWLLDGMVYPWGDAPIGLSPLTIPFLLVAMGLTWAVLPVQRGIAWVDHLYHQMTPPAATLPLPQGSLHARPVQVERLTKAWQLYGERGYPQAREAFLALVTAAPEQVEFWNGLGWAEFKLANYSAAGRAFRQALQRDPCHAHALDGLGWVLYQHGSDVEAQTRFQQALRSNLHLEDTRSGLGWLALRSRQVAEALAIFSDVLARDATSALAREGLGRALLAAQRWPESQRALGELLAQKSAGGAAIQAVADLHRAMLVHGERIVVDPREWQALAEFMGWRVGVIPVIAGVVLVSLPLAGGISLLLTGIGMAIVVALAGPGSLLWIDLHVQTVALTALLCSRSRHVSGLFKGVAVVVVTLFSVVVWVAAHHVGHWLPLLSFNVAGLMWGVAERWISSPEKCVILQHQTRPTV
ncbi:MAG: urea transporter [Magnetococcales bacterium]|nr:urea transporter [Magnetococcales bacterium]